MKKYPVLLTIVVVMIATPVFADTLTFTGAACAVASSGVGASVACSASSAINQSYGDTAMVDVTYKNLDAPVSGTSLWWWPDEYNDLLGVVWGFNGARIEIAPLTGSTIYLNSFDMGAWPNNTLTTHVRILELGTNAVLLDYGAQSIGLGSTTHDTFHPGVSSANGIAIEWRDTGNAVGMDNIHFSENAPFSAPEPTSFTMIVLGLSSLVALKTRAFRRANRGA